VDKKDVTAQRVETLPRANPAQPCLERRPIFKSDEQFVVVRQEVRATRQWFGGARGSTKPIRNRVDRLAPQRRRGDLHPAPGVGATEPGPPREVLQRGGTAGR